MEMEMEIGADGIAVGKLLVCEGTTFKVTGYQKTLTEQYVLKVEDVIKPKD
jgi:hypothetical protein